VPDNGARKIVEKQKKIQVEEGSSARAGGRGAGKEKNKLQTVCDKAKREEGRQREIGGYPVETKSRGEVVRVLGGLRLMKRGGATHQFRTRDLNGRRKSRKPLGGEKRWAAVGKGLRGVNSQ